MQEIDYRIYPKFRENIWRLTQGSQKTYLITTDEVFEVDPDDANAFLKIRPYCTGHDNIKEIALKSGVALEKVESIIDSLQEINLLYPSTDLVDSEEVIRNKLINLCKIWAEDLRINFIGNKLMEGKLPKSVLIGWLIEMYHYISDFPYAIDIAASCAEGELKTLLTRYANEERHHNVYVLRTLENLDIKEQVVTSSSPLLATRLIGFLMRELFQLCPSSVLLIAALIVIKANEFEDQVDIFKREMEIHYNISGKVFDPFFEHQAIDDKLGHATLLINNLHLLNFDNQKSIDLIINKLHDFKQAFYLMGVELEDYYTHLNGKYFPRQPIYFNAV